MKRAMAIILILVSITVSCSVREHLPVQHVLDTQEHVDVLHAFKGFINTDQTISFKVPLNGLINDYNTFYGNAVYILLNDALLNKDILNQLDGWLKDDHFMDKDEDNGGGPIDHVFDGAEKLYFIDQLRILSPGQYEFSNMRKHVVELIQGSYRGGYFLHDDIYDIFDGAGQESSTVLRLNQTWQTLILCKKYYDISQINVEEINYWLDEIEVPKGNCTVMYYIAECKKILGKSSEPFQMVLSEYTDYDLDNFDDVIALEYLMRLSSDGHVMLDQKIIDEYGAEISKRLQTPDISDLQKIYRYLLMLDLLGITPDESTRELISDLLHINSFPDGTFPTVTKYQETAKQDLMFTDVYSRLDPYFHPDQICRTEGGMSNDPYDIYANVALDIRQSKKPATSKEDLLNGVRSTSLRTVASLSYFAEALKALGYNIKDKDLPEEIALRIQQLSENPTAALNIADLMLIECCFDIVHSRYKDAVLEHVSKVAYDMNDEMAVYTCYFKYKILLKEDFPLERRMIAEELEKFRCKGGYKVNLESIFFDPMATHLVITLKSDYAL